MEDIKHVLTNSKIVFLDVDGVLNSDEFDKWLQDNHMKKYYGYELLDQKAILNLQDIVFTTGAEIVLSSSWRLSKSCSERLRQQLLPYGLQFVDRTVSIPHKDRGEEIKEWLSRHPNVTHFVILDDEFEMAGLEEHFVQTDFNTGLLPHHTEKAIKILMEG